MESRRVVFEQGDKLVLGAHVPTPVQMNKLRQAATSTDVILDNLDGLNEEIAETNQAHGEKMPQETPVGRPQVKKIPTPAKASEAPVKRNVVEVTPDPEPVLDRDSLFERELDGIAASAEAPVKAEPAPQQPQQPAIEIDLRKLLAETPGAPSPEQIVGLKKKYGENAVYLLGLGPGDVYVFTHLKRGQWQKIQETLAKLQSQNQGGAGEEQLKEKVVQYCVLWPSNLPVEFWYNSRAGVVDRVYDAIMMNSYFLSPQQTMFLTMQL